MAFTKYTMMALSLMYKVHNDGSTTSHNDGLSIQYTMMAYLISIQYTMMAYLCSQGWENAGIYV